MRIHVLNREVMRSASLAVAGAAVGLAPIWIAMPSLAAETGRTTVKANYRISFGGVSIGWFNFDSKVTGRRYELSSSSKVRLLFGAFKWGSESRTSGIVREKASPRSFDFKYYIKKKRKRASMRFARGSVVNLENRPRVRYSDKYVPLLPKHLIGVIDPMTAIMKMSRLEEGEPCRRKLDVFEGKMRFRLTLSPKGKRRIKERRPSGQPQFGYVCAVKFTPIAGHKKSSNIKYIAENDGIEIVLRPVPSAKLLMPYMIRVPTSFGSVVVSARSIDIVNAGNQRIAFQH